MSDRRPSKPELYVRDPETFDTTDGSLGLDYIQASVDEVLSFVRRGVESGEIEGEVVEWCDFHHAQGTTLGFCFVGAAPYSEAHKDCNMVEGLLIPGGGSE